MTSKKIAKKKKSAKKKAPAKKATPAKKVEAKFDAGRYMPKKKAKPAPVSELEDRFKLAVKPEMELAFKSAFELLIATILAAQSTDRTVNQVMPNLLAKYPDAKALAASEQEDVEKIVLRTGFFRNKAKSIRGTSQALVERHGGEVPNTMEELVALPGVARKTANVVLGSAFKISAGFIVDTHVMRVSQRLALTRHTDPVRIEQDLCKAFPQPDWVDLAHCFTLHGRYTCLAKAPMCGDCPINELCPSRLVDADGDWRERAQLEMKRAHAGVRDSRGH